MLFSFMNRKHRSYLAQYRFENLPLEIENGRWQNKPMEERICKVGKSGEVENEFHFTLYIYIRATFFQNLSNIIPNIKELNEVSQIKTFMSKNFVFLFAKLICDMLKKRHDNLFI